MIATPVLETRALTVQFGHGAQTHVALDAVDLSIGLGRTVGLVGESGSGKSTLSKALVGLVPPTSGDVFLDGVPLAEMTREGRAAARRRIQLIPQDPYSSLDPRRTIAQALAEAVDPVRQRVGLHRERIVDALEAVRLPADAMARYPHEFSGGQRQRIAIARALATDPEVIVADEITSALDVSVQADILDLIRVLRVERNLTMLFVSHNLAVVKQVSDEVVVLYRGRVMETAPVGRLFASPQSPYTAELLAAIPGAPGFSLEPR